MQVRLNDGTVLNAIVVYGRREHFQGTNRDTLEFHFSPDEVTFSELETLFGDESKTSKIIIVDENEENLHEHYVIRKSLSLKQVEIAPGDAETPPQYESRFVVEMAQLTYSERQQQNLQEADLDNKEAIATLYEMFLGGSVIHG